MVREDLVIDKTRKLLGEFRFRAMPRDFLWWPPGVAVPTNR